MALIAPGIHQPFGLGLLAHQMAVLVVALLQPEVACLDPLIHCAIVFRPCRYGDTGPNAYFAANLFPGMALIAPGIHQPFGLRLLAHQVAALVVALLQPEVACLDFLIHRAIVFRPRSGTKRLLCCQSFRWYHNEGIIF